MVEVCTIILGHSVLHDHFRSLLYPKPTNFINRYVVDKNGLSNRSTSKLLLTPIFALEHIANIQKIQKINIS
jgi:hypothetical protein